MTPPEFLAGHPCDELGWKGLVGELLVALHQILHALSRPAIVALGGNAFPRKLFLQLAVVVAYSPSQPITDRNIKRY